MYDPQRSFGFLVHDCAQAMRRNFERRARAIGLTRAQWAAIAHLLRNEGCNQSTLADLLDVEPITLARLLDRMETKGWVRRQPDPKDRRARLVFLTEKAKPMLEQLAAFAADTRAVAFAGFSPEEQERLIDQLIRIRNNLSGQNKVADRATRPAPTHAFDAEEVGWPLARRHG